MTQMSITPRGQMIRKRLIQAGVRNLKEFGYPTVTEETIMTDYVFRRFFISMLEENVGKGSAVHDHEINRLLEELRAKGGA